MLNKTRAIALKYAAPVVAAGYGLIGSAHAALPESVGTTMTAVQTDGKAMFDLVFPVVGALFGLMVVIKLFKRFGNKI